MPDLELGAALNAYSESLRALDKPPEDTEAGWLDVPKEAAASIAETVAQPLGAGQVATAVSDPDVSNLLGGLSMMGHEAARGLRASQSNVSRRAAEATIIPEEGKPSFLQTPIRSSAMQAAGLAGPGALLMGAAMLAPEGFLAGLITDASAGAVLGVAQTADRAAQYYNNPELTDDKLAEEDPRFKMLTEQGVDPKEARNIRMQEVVRDAPLYVNGLAGALGMGVGGRVLRRTTGGTGGVLSRATLGAGENAAGMGGMAAAGTYADQDLEIAQGKRTNYDYRKMFLAAAQGGALGAAMGTVGGVLHRPDGRRVREDNTPTVENTDSSQLDATRAVALTPETPPAPSVELSTLAAPGSKPVEPSGVKSQGVTEEEVAGLKGELPPKVEVEPVAPEVPVVHPGEPETPVATAAHPDVPEVTPPEAAPVTQQVTEPIKGTLLPKGYKGPKAATDASGASATVGLHYTEHPDVFTVDGSFLPDELRGKGVGYNLYKRLANKAIAAGKPLISDYNISESALRTYKKLEKDGYNVEYAKGLHEGTEEAYPGSYIPGEDDSFTVRVTGKKARERAPKPEALAPEAPAPTPAPALPPTEARVDPATGRRILEGPRWGEKEGWQTMPGQAEVPRPAPTEEPSKGHSAQIVLDQQAKNHEIATRILNSREALVPFTENTHANREMLRTRLQEQVSEALASGFGVIKKAKGSPFENRIPARSSKQPGEVMWLADAQRMLRALNAKKIPELDELNKFITDENAGRSGQWDVMAARRKGEGAAFGEAKKKEAAAEAAPEEASGGDAMDRLKSSEPTPEDIILQHEEELKQQLETRAAEEPVEEEPTQEAPSRERPAPKIEGEAYTAVKERTTPVTAVRAGVRGRGRYEGMRPKVAEKVALSRKLKEKVEQEAKKPLAVFGDTKAERDARDALIETMREATRYGDIVPNSYGAKDVRAIDVVSVKKMFAAVGRTGIEGKMKGFESAFFPIFRNRVLEHVGDMKVYVVDKAQMKRLVGDERASPPLGYYDPMDKHIVLRADAAADPSEAAWVFLHEGLHAAYHDAIEHDPLLKFDIARVMKQVEDHIYNTEPELIGDTRYTYGITNEHEFISEAFSNKHFQELLSRVHITSRIAKELRLDKDQGTAWDWLLGQLRKVFKLPKSSYTALEAVVRLGEQADTTRRTVNLDSLDNILAAPSRAPLRFAPERMSSESERVVSGAIRGFLDKGKGLAEAAADPVKTMADTINDLSYTGSGFRSAMGRVGRYLETNDQFRQRIEKYWPGFLDHNTVRRVFDNIQRMGSRAKELTKEGQAISVRMARLQKQFPGAFDRFSTLVHNATMFGVDPASAIGAGRNRYLGFSKEVQAKLDKGVPLKDIIHQVNHAHIEAIEEHPRMKAEYDALVEKNPEFAKLMDDTFSFFHDAQQEMTRGHIENILRATVRGDQGGEHVIKRRAQELLEAHKSDELYQNLVKEFGGDKEATNVADSIWQAKAFSGREGPYAPLMRHGDWVVHGRYKIKAPTNALAQTGPNVYEFATKREAVDFARSTGLHREFDTAYYDPATGEKTTKLGGVSVAGGPEQRWVVKLQDKYVKFHTRKSEALREYNSLKNNPLFDTINQPERRDNLSVNFREGELSANGMQTVIHKLEKQEHYLNATPAERDAMKRALEEASISMMGGNRMQSRRLPRRRVEGYSDNLMGNFDIYNRSQANFRAKQEYRPQIDQALKDLRDQYKSPEYSKPDDPAHTLRSEYLEEIEKRARAADPNDYTGAWANFTRELSTWSYIYRMGRASHLILHQTHLPMITAPIIAGRHGVFKSYAATLQAWKELTGAYKHGGKDVYKALADTLHEGTDYATWIRGVTSEMKDAGNLHKMFKELEDLGILHPQYEVEIQRHIKSLERGGILGAPLRMMNHFDTVFRHATNATETINRYAGAMAAYRVEYAKALREGKTKSDAHDLAVEYTRNTIANTQGLYTSTNAAPLFKNRVLRPFLQFKQFPQMIYNLMAVNLTKALKGATTREKIEGLSSFAALLGTHTLMTGLLGGVPLESAKIIGTVSKGLGVTNGDWSDVERWQYDRAVDMFGKTGADYIMHGLSRALGIDAHHRLGLNSFYTFGLPEGSENNAKNIWAFLGQQAAGAPGGLFADGLKATHKVMNGDVGDGLAQLAPQQLRDVYKAWSGGGKDYKYSGGEAVARILGFTPSGEAEYYERKAETRSQVESYNKERGTLMRRWADASGSDKASAWEKIQKFNNSQKDKDAKITMKELTDSAKRRKKAEDEGDVVHGVRLGKHTRSIGERANAIY